MKILHIAETIQGGIASYLNDLAVNLAKQYGAENITFAVPKDQMTELKVPLGSKVIEMPARNRSPLNLLNFGFKSWRVIRDVKPDVLHTHSSVTGAVVRPIAFLSKLTSKFKTKVFYSPHGWSFMMENPGWKQKTYSAIERILTPLTDKVILVSPAELEAAKKIGFSKKMLSERLKVIETGIPELELKVDLGAHKDDGFPSHDQGFWQTDAFPINLIFAGRLDRQKGFDVLSAAMDRMDKSQFCLHVFGETIVDENSPKTELSQSENILMYGWQPREKLLCFLPKCDAVIMPSRWEGLPILALEACRAGVPLVTSNIAVLKELVEYKGCGVLFEDGDTLELVKALKSIGGPSWHHRGKLARMTYESRFTYDQMFKDVCDLYEGQSKDGPNTELLSC